MEASLRYLKTLKLEPVFIFLFFFNTFLLPQGITFTLLLTPIWLYLLRQTNRLYLLRYFLAAFVLYTAVHIYLGVDIFYYALSSTMLLCVVIFCLAAWRYISDNEVDYDYLFKRIVLANFIFTLISLPLLYLPPLKSLVWYEMSMSPNIKVIPRLKLFTYEASHYGYLIAPLVIYFYCKAMLVTIRNAWPTLFMITVPLLLSISFGVIGCLIVSGLLFAIIYFRRLFDTRRKKLLLVLILSGVAITLFILYRYFPNNILFIRLHNITTGEETSARGRTYESFILANKIIAQKSYLWGIGPGQLKLFGRTIIVQYYYYSRIPEPIRIPNACAETIVCFGYVGFVLRIGLQLVLFYITRVIKSPFRLWLFLFLFIFQFTGSYITNVTEYVFWMFAFSPALDLVEGRQRQG